jgi:4-amino-4-deoxy-L-arabinose transferase-like glycosyltransferase
MLQRGEYVDYYFDDQRDDWLAKPPFGVWLIALSYRLLGFNEWALRTPSALAGVGIIVLTYLLVRLYRSAALAALVALVLMLCRGIVGHHVARSGDLDAVYVLTAMAMIYTLQLSEVRHRRWLLPIAGLFGGLCFMTKGFMMGIFLPGLGLYMMLSGQVLKLLKDWLFWVAVTIFGAAIGGWYLAVKKLGTPFASGQYGVDAWDVMVNYDIFRRYTEKLEGNNTTSWFVMEALDIRFGPWLYLLILVLLYLGWRLRPTLRRMWAYLGSDHLMLLSTCMVIPTCVLFASSATKFNWYVAITIPFLAIMTLVLTDMAAKLDKRVWRLFGLVTVIGVIGQLQYLFQAENGLSHQLLLHIDKVKSAKQIYVERQPLFNTRLALKWRGRQIDTASEEVLQRPRIAVSPKIDRIDEADGGYSLMLKPAAAD